MKLEELQREAKQDLNIEDQESLDQESYKNQNIKAKWLEYRTKYDQLLIIAKADHQRLYRQKWEYYGGKADAKVYAAKPFDLKVLNNELQMYINSDEDSSYYIKLVLEENNMDYDSNTVEYIEDQCRPIIRHYKNHYNRPRPYQVAEALGIDFEKYETGTSKTPSSPSGHTVQPYVVANYYGKLYPELKSELRQAADISGFGRVIAGLHFPSDYKAGIMLADQLYQYIKFDTISEDAPLNSTGDAVQTNHPLMHSKSLYRRKNQQDTKRLYKLLKKRYN